MNSTGAPSPVSGEGAGSRESGWSGQTGATHVGFVTTGLEDEFLWLVLPALHRGVGGSKAGGPEGEPGLTVFFLHNTWVTGLLAAPEELVCSLPSPSTPERKEKQAASRSKAGRQWQGADKPFEGTVAELRPIYTRGKAEKQRPKPLKEGSVETVLWCLR